MTEKQNKYTYFVSEESKLTMIQSMNNESPTQDYRRFDVDLQDLKKYSPSAYAKATANSGLGLAENATPFAQAVIGTVDAGFNAVETGKLHDSTLSGLGAIGNVNEVGAITSSDRLSIWGKIGEVFSWIGSLFSGIIPFGKAVSGTVECGSEVYNACKNTTRNISYDRDDVEDMFHLQDVMTSEQDIEAAQKTIASTLDQNHDGTVDELEMQAAQTLLDKNNDGHVSADEVKAHGGWEGALAFVREHHKDAIDETEYDEEYARLLLREKLGNQATDVIGRRFQELDVNGDGEVSREEFRGALAVFDKNADRVVSYGEIKPYRDNPDNSFDMMVNHLRNNDSGRG